MNVLQVLMSIHNNDKKTQHFSRFVDKVDTKFSSYTFLVSLVTSNNKLTEINEQTDDYPDCVPTPIKKGVPLNNETDRKDLLAFTH